MAILDKNKLNDLLRTYYIENYGERESDEWIEHSAVNVWVFKRDNKYITLQCHILDGKVTAQEEECQR